MTKTKRKRKPLDLSKVKKLSTLLQIGLRDLRKQERAPKSEVDMATWLSRNGKCSACLAGSVMRWSMGISVRRGESLMPMPFDSALYALDELRFGYVSSAANYLGVDTRVEDNFFIAEYRIDPKQWWRDMRRLLADLKKAGE